VLTIHACDSLPYPVNHLHYESVCFV